MNFPILAAALLTVINAACAAAPDRVLIVVGPSDHPPGTHEVAAGGRVLRFCVENMINLPGVKAEVVYDWPDAATRDAAATVVFIGDTFQGPTGSPIRRQIQLTSTR